MPDERKSGRTILDEWLLVLETHDDDEGRGTMQSADLAFTVGVAGVAIVEALDRLRDTIGDPPSDIDARRIA